ncbi:MAG: hypothetical protein ACYST2_06850 [Planctomycetota bacterium]
MNNTETSLVTNEESGLVFDYFFGYAEEQIDRVSVLITSNPKAAEIYSYIEQTLAKLGYMKDEDCPDELVDMTIARLKLATIKEPLPHNNGSQ